MWISTLLIIFSDMYGYKGSNTDSCVYPTVRNIRETFYEYYEGSDISSYNATKGEIPIVGNQYSGK